MREIYFHEDDHCQLEILPINNIDYCRAQISEISSFSAKNKKDDGWSDVYEKRENPIALESFGIPVQEFRISMCNILPEYEQIYTGFGSHRELCENVIAFGKDGYETIFADVNSNGVIFNIWCSDPTLELLNIPNFEDYMFVDWGLGFVCPLADKEGFDAYCLERERVISERVASWEIERKLKLENTKKWWKFW